jgi:hypothetical protein
LKAFVVTEQFGNRTATFPIPVESASGVVLTEPPRPVWLDDLFGIAAAAAERGDVVDIRFDSVLGYISRIEVRLNPRQQNERFDIRDFERIGRD